MTDLTDYIDFEQIVEDFNLNSGDICFSQIDQLERILAQYIKQNK